MTDIEATVTVKLRPLSTPNCAVAIPDTSIPLGDLSADTIDALVENWLTEVYKKAGLPSPWSRHD